MYYLFLFMLVAVQSCLLFLILEWWLIMLKQYTVNWRRAGSVHKHTILLHCLGDSVFVYQNQHTIIIINVDKQLQ